MSGFWHIASETFNTIIAKQRCAAVVTESKASQLFFLIWIIAGNRPTCGASKKPPGMSGIVHE